MPAIDPSTPGKPPHILRKAQPGPAVRRRTAVDTALVTGVALIVCVPAGDPVRTLGFGALAVAAGLIYFVVRRGNDLAMLASTEKWRDTQIAGKGISLAEWRKGATLAPWAGRAADPVEKRV